MGLDGAELDGCRLAGDTPVYPCWAVLPMGFSWSLYFAQAANAQLAAQVLGTTPCRGLSDRGPTVVLRPAAGIIKEHYVYVDNWGCLCSDEDAAKEAVSKWVEAFEAEDLKLHLHFDAQAQFCGKIKTP